MTITVKNGQTIFDVALIAYQDAARVCDLLEENPQIENLMSDLTGLTLNYTPAVITTKEVIKTVYETKPNVTIRHTQSVFDIALQYYGGAEKVFDFIKENGLESILSDPTAIELKYTLSNEFVPFYFRTNQTTVSTKPLN